MPVCAVAPAGHFVSVWQTLGTGRCCACSAHSTVAAAAAPAASRRWAVRDEAWERLQLGADLDGTHQ